MKSSTLKNQIGHENILLTSLLPRSCHTSIISTKTSVKERLFKVVSSWIGLKTKQKFKNSDNITILKLTC